jgi:proline dehydrogenase
MLPPLARRFLAGETAAEALEHARRRDSEGINTILNLLGEHYADPAEAAADAQAYCQLIQDIAGTDLHVCISVKPTQLGLDVGEATFRKHLNAVVERAAAENVFVWIDMEAHDTVDATLDAFETQARKHDGGVGVCVQANLRRTGEDLERLAGLPGKVRLVKGAYNPPTAVAYQSSTRVDEQAAKHLRYMFRAFDDGIALGSHDPALITLAADLHATYKTPYEIQMLAGVRTGAQRELAKHHDLSQYVPYGKKWPAYFYRRMTERTENITFALRALAPFE